MSETPEPTITSEQIAAYHRHLAAQERQQAAQEQAAMRACISALQSLASKHGYEIVAQPQFTPDGRTVADWGVRRKAQ